MHASAVDRAHGLRSGIGEASTPPLGKAARLNTSLSGREFLPYFVNVERVCLEDSWASNMLALRVDSARCNMGNVLESGCGHATTRASTGNTMHLR